MKFSNCLDCGKQVIKTAKKGPERRYCDKCLHERFLKTKRKVTAKWTKKYPVEAKKRARANYEQSKQNPKIVEKTKLRNKNYLKQLRIDAINSYGGKCECCGESQYEFLAFDHINGGGRKHRKSLKNNGGFLRWLRDNNYPQEIRILCHNCNMAEAFYGKCPHKK